MQGRRVDDIPSHMANYRTMQPGDYAKLTNMSHRWAVCDPTGSVGMLGDAHTVTEHEDGTITVSPSILDPNGWHGWLERGVWRSC